MTRPRLTLCAIALLAAWSVASNAAGAGPHGVAGAEQRLGRHLVSADPTAVAGEVCVRGRLTDEGVECQAMRGADGRLYTLAGDLAGLAAEAEACVCGRVAELSTCMQGITLAVSRVGPPALCE